MMAMLMLILEKREEKGLIFQTKLGFL